MNSFAQRLVAIILIVPLARLTTTAFAVTVPPVTAGNTYDEKFDGEGSDDWNNPTALPFSFPNPNTLRGSVGGYGFGGPIHDFRDIFSLTVSAGETVKAIDLSQFSGDPHTWVYLEDGKKSSIISTYLDPTKVGTNLLGSVTLDPGDYKFTVDGHFGYMPTFYEFDFIFTGIENFAAGELLAGSAQVGIQGGTYQFQLLSNQINGVVNGLSGGGMNFVTLPQAAPTASDVQLVSYEDSGVELASYRTGDGVRQRAQNSPVLRGGWDGWVNGYGIGGQVESRGGVAGLNYGAGGTQMGIYRLTNDGTLIGLFGGYGYQNVETGDGSEADINSGMVGSFLHRGDHRGNYYILAGNAAFDNYDTSRTGGIRGDFDGVQTGVYLERGWTRHSHGLTVQPNVSLQYIWVHQDDHTETGLGGVSVDEVDAHSLRSMVGATFYGDDLTFRRGSWLWTPNASADWMHELLDTATTATGSLGGTPFFATGLDLGRDWAVLGVGMTGERNRAVTLYGNYDIQINDRQTFHSGSGGLVWSR